ncbi:MAG TPA: alpha/beta hydrolase-fold protein [Terriglobales bacterium]|nr:alpha/beta hydrolase-fold protein [Terriglobales bacterium]
MRLAAWLTTCLLLAGSALAAPPPGSRFQLSFPASAHAGAITGRVFVFVSRAAQPEPRLVSSGYTGTSPFFAADVSQLAPGQTAVVDASAAGFPLASLSKLPAGDYYVQGLLNVYTRFPRADGHVIWAHMDQWEGQHFNRSPGNLYSAVRKIHWDPAASATVDLSLDHAIPPLAPPADTVWVKHVKIQSPMLSKFWGHPIYLGATILLPAGYDQHPQQSYPVVYDQGHFGLNPAFRFSTTPHTPTARERELRAVDGVETGYEFYQEWTAPGFPRMIVVSFQHPTPYYDDSYAVNSVNSGPYGDAILQELIPYVETHFRIVRKPSARMLTGGSTGGWESMALELHHPDFFGGTWTFYPDPLDFHHFQSVNLYDDPNAFLAPASDPWAPAPRYMMRQPDGQPLVTYRQMSQDEAALGTHGRSGEQLDVFFATFGPIGADGYPVGLWDLKTGQINRAAVAYARDHGYDLTAYMQQHWATLGPKLVGKIHVYVGDMDTYYLNLGVYGMQDFMKTTQNPHYEGAFFFGRPEKPHGWNGGMTNGELLRQIAQAVRP